MHDRHLATLNRPGQDCARCLRGREFVTLNMKSHLYIYIFFVLFYQAFLSADCVKTHHYNEQNEVSQGERETDRESVQSV